MSDRWVWIDSTWLRTDDFLPEIVIFARNYDDPTVTKTFTITDFRPYFYCPASAAFHPREVTQVDSHVIRDAKGREIRKVYVRLPSDVRQARASYDWTVEADIQFDFRYMLDKEVSYAFTFDEHDHIVPAPVPKTLLPRICFFDIEVRSPPTQFPKPAEAKWPIVSIQCMDSYTGEITIFTFGVPQLVSDQVACRTENEMLRAFMDYLQKYDPDVLTGWNTNGFDIPYIVNRAKNLKVKLNRMTRLPQGYNKPVAELRQGTPADTPEEEKKKKKRKEEWFVRCTGRQLLDMLDAFKKFWKAEGELDSYTLKAIARNPDVMGDDVYVYEEQGSNMEKLFKEERWDDFLSYCRSDVIALSKIDRKIKLFDFYENLRMMCGIKLEDTMKNSRIIETYLFRDPIMKPMPTRRYDIVGESYEGALVLTPKVGIFNNVAVYDLNALYPHIIIAFDLSPDIDHVIPRVIRYVMDERTRLKQLIKEGKADEADKKKEVVLKFIANSFYGVLGWDKFRLYDPEIAAFITRTGREINEYLQGLARNVGLEPLYGDSVAPTTPVIIRRNDRIHIIPIDYCQPGDLTYNGSWVQIKHVIRKPLRKQMYHVSTGHGNVVCTCDHSLIKDGREVCPQDLDKGDSIDHIGFPVQEYVEIESVGEDIAWITGLFLAEGSRFNEQQFVINNQDLDLLEECAKRIKRVSGKDVRISDYMDSSNCHRIAYIPTPISAFLADCYVENTWHSGSPCPYQTTGYKIIPAYILNASPSVQQAFFDGYYEGDGSKVSHRAIDSKNECLALGLHYIAENLGQPTRCCIHKKSLSWGLRFPGGKARKNYNTINDLIQIVPERLWFNHVVDLEIDDDSHTFASGKILLHNTDSVFLMGVRDVQHGIEVQNYFNKQLIDDWTVIHKAKISPQLKFEEYFRTVMFKPSSTNLEESAKKRYAGHVLFADGKPADRLLYKGIEVRRSDQADLIKKTLLRFLELVLMEDKYDEAIELIKTEYYNVRDGRTPLMDISIPQGITDMEANSPRVRGVLLAEEIFGIPYTGGEKPRLVYTRGNHDAICLYDGIPVDQIPLKVRVDYPLMAEKIITKKMESYVLALGKNLRHILEGQQTLSSTWFE